MLSFDPNSAYYDRDRGAVVVRTGRFEFVIVHDAIEAYVNRKLDSDEAVAAVTDYKSVFRAAGNATPAFDGVITLTARIMAERDWTLAAAGEET